MIYQQFLLFQGSLIKAKIEATFPPNGHNEKELSFNLIDDDDLEVDGDLAPGEGEGEGVWCRKEFLV